MSRCRWLIPAVLIAVGSAQAQGPQITNTAVPPGTVGQPYSVTFTATGGTLPYQWSFAGDPLPGLNLDATTGILSGTPTATVMNGFTITVEDHAGNTNRISPYIVIAEPVTVIGRPSLPGGVVGVVWPAQVLGATGGGGRPFNWVLSSGSLPPGLTLNATGVISGTPTSASGSPFTFSVTASDPEGRVSAAQAFSIMVIAAVTPTPASLTLTSSLNPVRYGQTVTLTASVTPAAATGKVTFYDGISILGTEPVSAGKAILRTTLPVAASHSLRACFNGLPFYTPAGSGGLPRTVNVAPGDSFQAVPNSSAQVLAVADFNGDGVADLATPNGIVLGNGDGTFQTLIAWPAADSLNDRPDEAVLVADFNGDGKPDVATYLGVMPGNGDGTFQTLIAYPPGIGELGDFVGAVADFNGDGVADLATPNGIILGNGDGTFQLPVLWTADNVVAGDFNGDGKADVFVNGINGYGDWVALGNGDGTFTGFSFTPVVTIPEPVPNIEYFLAVGDFNGDGKDDLIIVPNPGVGFTIYLSNGDGTFTPGQTYGGVGSLSVADFDGDGKLDIASPGSTVYLGNGDGTFRESPPGSPVVGGTLVADLNGDGRVDIVSPVLLGVEVTLPLLITPDGLDFGTIGTPYTATFTATGGTPPYKNWSVAANDSLPAGLSLDATTGVLSGTPTAAGTTTFSVTMQDSLGNVSTAQSLSISIGSAVSITKQSLPSGVVGAAWPSQTVVATGGSGPPYSWTVSSGSLPPGLTLNAATGVISGTPTSASGSPFAFNLEANDPAGRYSTAQGFSIAITAVTPTPTSVALTSSVNPARYGQAVTLTAALTPAGSTGKVTFYDGVNLLGTVPVSSGVAVVTTSLLSAGSHALRAYFNGLPLYAPAASTTLPATVNAVAGNDFQRVATAAPDAIAVADFNGDGIADLAAVTGVLLGNGDGTFQPLIAWPHRPIVGVANYYYALIGDFNGDGKPDVAAVSGVMLGNGDGTFQAPIPYPAGTGAVAFNFIGGGGVADFNGDGVADLATTGSLLLGNGDGTFQPPVPLSVTSVLLYNVVAGDFNGDGKADLFVMGTLNQVLLGNGDGTFATVNPGLSFPQSLLNNQYYLATPDFNGDGKSDLLISSLGYITTFISNGDGTFTSGVTYTVDDGPTVGFGDFNGDGKLDIALLGAEVLLGNGDGTLQPGVLWPVDTGTLFVGTLVADFNGDGRADILSSSATVLLGSVAPPGPQITTTSLPVATIGTSYSATLGATGGTPPYGNWTVASGGSLPAGLSLYATTGVLSGTPTTAGTSTFSASVQDSLGTVSPGQSLSISIAAPPPSVTSLSPAMVTAGSAALTLTVNGAGFVSGAVVVFSGTHLTTTFVNTAQLTATVPTILLATPGSASVAAVNPGAITSNSSAFTVNPAIFTSTATHLFVTAPSTANAGLGFTFTVTALDANNQPVPNFSASVQFTSSDASAALPADITLNETGSFSTSLVTPGAQTITVSVLSSPSILGTSGSIMVTPAGGSLYVPVSPCRLVDTRNTAGPFGGPSLPASGTRSFAIPSAPGCNIPTTAEAYSLNLTVVPQGTLGYVTMWQTGQAQPVVSTLNSIDGRVKANAAIVPAGTGGAVSVFATDETDVVLDISGYFTAASDSSGKAFYPVTPCRLVDTRAGAPSTVSTGALIGGAGRTLPLLSSSCNVPATAVAYSLNFTVIPSNGMLGYLTVYPTGVPQPVTSTLNALTGAIVANAAVVPAGTGGSIDVFATDTTDLVVDINGYFATPGTGGLSFYPVSPCRVLDSRNPSGTPPFTGTINVNVVGGGCENASTAQAYVLNATVVPPGPLGYLTLWPEGSAQPLVSTLNALDGSVTSNMAIVPANGNAITAFADNATYLILDTFGYFAP